MTQGGEPAHIVQQRTAVPVLGLNRQAPAVGIYGEIELVGSACREARRGATRPLHRRTRTGTIVASLTTCEAGQILHAYLVTIIYKGNAGHSEEKGHRYLQLVGGVTRADVRPLVVVVSRRQGNVAQIARFLVGVRVVFYKL